MLRALLVVVLSFTACAKTAPEAGAESGPAMGPQRADEAPSPDLERVLATACNEPCAGRFARLVVFRDADGNASRVRLDGDLESCSHPPRVYFDMNGTAVLRVPEEPVTRERAEALGKEQDAAVAGLTEAESLRCPVD